MISGINNIPTMFRNLVARLREGGALTSEQAANYLTMNRQSGALVSECGTYVATFGDDPADSETFEKIEVGGGASQGYRTARFADPGLFALAFSQQNWLICENKQLRRFFEQFDKEGTLPQ